MPCSTAFVRRMLSPSRTRIAKTKPLSSEKKATDWWPFLFHLIDRAPQGGCQLASVVVGPEVHEIKSRLLSNHVRVKSGDVDPVAAKDRNDAAHFRRQHHEVSGNCRPAATRRLKVDRGRDAHRWKDEVAVPHDLLPAWETYLAQRSVE